MKSSRISRLIIELRTNYTQVRSLLGPTIYNVVACPTALFLDHLPTSIEALSPRNRRFHHSVALVTRRLHISQWQHRTTPAHLLFIKRSKATFKVFHDMRIMLRSRRPLAFMTYCTTYLIKSVALDIRMNFKGLWGIRHFWIF